MVPNGWMFPFVCLFKSFFISSRKERCLRKMLTIFNDGKESKPLLSVDEKGKVD